MPSLALLDAPEESSELTYFESLLIVAAALYVAGRIGLQLSIPPSYTSILWPPTGIALAACLLGGMRMAFSVLIGFFLTGLSLSGTIEAWFAALLAGFATLQTVATVWLVRYLIGFPDPVWRGERVPFFLLLSGPIGAVISATLACTCYVAIGIFPAGAFWAHWLTHWTGDSLGALVFLPICLTLAARKGHPFSGRRLSVALPLVTVFLLTAAVFRTTLESSMENGVHDFLEGSKRLAAAVNRAFSTRLDALAAAAELYGAMGSPTAEGFEAFARSMRKLNPGSSTIFWAPIDETSAAEIRWISPPREGAAGFRIGAQESLGRGLERCLRDRSPTLVCRPELPGKPLQREEALVLLPVSRAGRLDGVIGMMLWVPAVLGGGELESGYAQLGFLLMEAGGTVPESVVWSSLSSFGGGDGAPAGHRSRWRNFLEPGGQLLELQCWATTGGLDAKREVQLWVVSLCCLVLTAALGAALLEFTGRRAARLAAREGDR